MSNLLDMPLVLAALAFTAGYVLAKLGALFGRREKAEGKHDPDRDRQYRAMEADLRVARKQLEQAAADTQALKQQRGELQADLDDRGGELLKATSELADLREQLRDECGKTQKLRNELSHRAEEGIRAKVQLRDIETELSLAQAGSDAVNDEIGRLAAEREELTERLRQLQREQQALEAQELVTGPAPPGPGDDPVAGALASGDSLDDAEPSQPPPRRRRTDIAFDC